MERGKKSVSILVHNRSTQWKIHSQPHLCKMSNQRKKDPGIAAAVVGAKCKKIPHRPGHDVPKKADDEPALLPPLATKFDVKVNYEGDPRQSGQWFNRDRGCRCSCLAVVRHRWCWIKEGGGQQRSLRLTRQWIVGQSPSIVFGSQQCPHC
jgi:hypothetical protein